LEYRRITTYEIGFIIAPRINALGRLEHAIDALRLLCTKKATLAQMLAAKISHKNRERQDLVIKSVGEAVEEVKKQQTLKNIVVLSSKIWHEGIIGLIASRLVDEFYRPTIIITSAGEFAKGSARSIPGFDITSLLRLQKKYLIDVGGHKGASGFTIEKDRIEEFIISIEKQAQQILTKKDLEKIINVDLSIPLAKINSPLVKKIEKLQPFGIGNPEPLFYSEGELIKAKLFGKNDEHLKIYLKDGALTPPLELVLFNQGQQIFKLSVGQKVPVIFNLEINRWNGKEQVRGKGKHILVHLVNRKKR
jgi:single-stranded-DNA-specific exonuclease